MSSTKQSSTATNEVQGILLVDKPAGKTAFSLVAVLRKILNVQKIGHAGTLDPFATGVMVMLIGRNYTRCSDGFLGQDKAYVADVRLGIETDTYDCDGKICNESAAVPSHDEVLEAVSRFQGEIEQIPPMYSAKKVGGKKLYELARKGKEIARMPVKINVHIQILSYEYPIIRLQVSCSKGTYIRSLAHDMGMMLKCGAHLTSLRRIRSGNFSISECLDGALLNAGIDAQSITCRLLTNH